MHHHTHKTILLSLILFFSSLHLFPIIPSEQLLCQDCTIKTVCNDKISHIISIIDENLIQSLLEELISIGPRMTGTYGCEKAGDYIFNTFSSLGLNASFQYWQGFGNRWHPGFYKSANIQGTLLSKTPIDGEVIIFNAHYDTVEDTVGANDDGSGVVAVLAAAYALSQFSFNRTIKFVTFSGEEIGLLGSTSYVKQCYQQNEKILVEFNADMVGKAETVEQGKSIRLSFSEDTSWIINTITQLLQTYDIIDLQVTGTYPYDRDSTHGGSDYFPFIQYGYESIAFWQATSDPYMHTPQDDLNNVNISYLVKTTRLIASTIASIADENNRPISMTIATPKKGFVYWKDRSIYTFPDIKTRVFDNIWIYLDINTYNAPIDKVEFYIDGNLQYTVYDIPFVWNLNIFSIRNHKLTVIAYDTNGGTSTDQISFLYWNIRRSN